MNERDKTRFQDMLNAARKAKNYVTGKERSALEADDFLLGFAVVRAVEIIGEAAGKVTPETRLAYPQISWMDMIGMRNRIVHEYLRVDYDIVWRVATEDVPELITELEKILLDPQ